MVLACWPNAGYWNPMQKEENGDYYGKQIPHTDAESVRLSIIEF